MPKAARASNIAGRRSALYRYLLRTRVVAAAAVFAAGGFMPVVN